MRLAVVAMAAACALASGCATDEGGEFEPLANATVIGSVTGLGGGALDSVLIGITVPDQVSSLFDIATGFGLTDTNGRFSITVGVQSAVNPDALADTLAIYITATAAPPRYTPPGGEPNVRDSVLVPVAFAAAGDPTPVTETELTLPVAP